SIVWGLVLFVADWKPKTDELKQINFRTAMFVGLAQAIAIIPGTSRSGITITAGLLMGLNRTAAARFSFLLSVPVSMLAGGYETTKLLQHGMDTPWSAVIIGFIIAFVVAYLTVHFFMKLITRTSMTAFVIYRVLLGILLLLMYT
ncbi:MAG: undecaprenyl-diphosphate phosphatase, partial [Thermodesulfobacteriota bacterium]